MSCLSCRLYYWQVSGVPYIHVFTLMCSVVVYIHVFTLISCMQSLFFYYGTKIKVHRDSSTSHIILCCLLQLVITDTLLPILYVYMYNMHYSLHSCGTWVESYSSYSQSTIECMYVQSTSSWGSMGVPVCTIFNMAMNNTPHSDLFVHHDMWYKPWDCTHEV